ncbi:lysosomal-associated transmembrane protein 4B isoform X2 [Chiloscyllium punctatum]|uniref:lysosomal-associated transmembrane protein 4B isoform X2 n=1 Tax=Chiloscyllium punctatum TaxID=137246 RepID=UPI003B642009
MRTESRFGGWYSSRCCFCCHVRTGTIILGTWYMLINGVVLVILLSALSDPERYYLTHTELGTDFDLTDDANICIATAVSLLMITICGMATYGAYKQLSAWIVPFFCYQIFDFALNTLVAISVVIYPNSIQDYLRQLAYLIGCVWNCYRYINGRRSADVLVYVTNDTAILLPPSDEAVTMPTKGPPPPYMSA